MDATLAVHNHLELSCACHECLIIPSGEHEGGRGQGEQRAQDGSGPARPKRKARAKVVRHLRVSFSKPSSAHFP